MKYFFIILSLFSTTLKSTEIFISNEESWGYRYMAAKVSYDILYSIFPGGYQKLTLNSDDPYFYIELSYATLNYHYITRFWISNLQESSSDKFISLNNLLNYNKLPSGLIILRKENSVAKIPTQEILFEKYIKEKKNKESIGESSKKNDSFLSRFYRKKSDLTSISSIAFAISKIQAIREQFKK